LGGTVSFGKGTEDGKVFYCSVVVVVITLGATVVVVVICEVFVRLWNVELGVRVFFCSLFKESGCCGGGCD